MPNFDLRIAHLFKGITPVEKIMKGDELVWPMPYDCEVEYIRCTGTQYTSFIPISIPAGDFFEVTMELICNQTSVVSDQGRYFRADSEEQFSIKYYTYNSGSNYSSFSTSVGASSGTGNGVSITNGVKRTIIVSTTQVCNNTSTVNSLTRNITSPLSSFRVSGPDVVADICRVKIRHNNNIIYDLMPVRKGNIGYFYDEISKQLFGSNGNDAFGYGADVESKVYDAEVEWIQCNGSSRINTGIKVAPTTTFHFEMYMPQATAIKQPFGGRSAYQSNALHVANDSRTSGGTNVVTWFYGNKSVTTTKLLDWHTFDNTAAVNKLVIDNSTTLTVTGASMSSTNEDFYIFAINIGGGSGGNSGDGLKSKAGQMYSNGVLVRDFIPVKKNGVGYLYDKISKKLFGNENRTGIFTCGSVVTT